MFGLVRCLMLGAALLSVEKNGVELKVESETTQIDPARSVFLTMTMTAGQGVKVVAPDLRPRVRGFSLAEDFEEEPKTGADGRVTTVVNWRLVPEPCAAEYKVAPFVVGVETAKGAADFYAGPIRFEAPAAREPVTGGMEADPKKVLPPLSWKLVGYVALAIVLAAAVLVGLIWLVKYVARRVKEHRMSPIERAWVELDRLLKKGLPARGKYKDFYVELTMVVRRYVQRKYGIRAPNLTTEEFFAEVSKPEHKLNSAEALKQFLESADMVKFAGVDANEEMAKGATNSARTYLKDDNL
jgi:hypothetical protein